MTERHRRCAEAGAGVACLVAVRWDGVEMDWRQCSSRWGKAEPVVGLVANYQFDLTFS